MEFYKLFCESVERKALKKVWLDESGYVYAHSFMNGYITERLTLERVKKWNPHTPVMISAQTGAGKTTFVLKTLLLVMKEKGKRMVILCSRSVLAQQIKRAAAKIEMPDSPDDLIEAYIKYRSKFGAVDVYTYQEVVLRFQDEHFVKDFQYYGAVVCDECHFFVQDAAFNQYTGRVFQFIQKYAKRSVRVYLTATPEPVADIIADSEYSNRGILSDHTPIRGGLLTSRFLFYTFARDYEYINPFFFQDWNILIGEIDKHSSEEKWLIFVSRKDDGRRLQELLGAERALFIDAELKNGEKAEEMKKMVEVKQFHQNILIVTKFLDVGVDFWDSQLKNVVLSTLDKTEFIQALGRKRVRRGECVNAYIQIPDIQEISKRKQAVCLQMTQVYEHKRELDQNGYLKTEIPFPFYMESKGGSFSVQYNTFTPVAFKQQKLMLNEFCEDAEVGTKERIARRFLIWLGIEGKYQKERWLDEEVSKDREEIERILLAWLGHDLSALEYKEFCKCITDYARKNFPDSIGTHSERDMGTKKIRDFFRRVGIVYEIKNLSTGIHRIERG